MLTNLEAPGGDNVLCDINPELVDLEVIEIDSDNDYTQLQQKEGNATKFKLVTWNLWCMIFAPRTLSNPQRCGNYVLEMAKNENWMEFDGLIICTFQELWSWKTGLFPPILLRFIAYFEYIPYLGVLISFVFQFITLLFGLLPIFKCLPIFIYNPKAFIASKLHEFVPYSYFCTDIPLRNILDNGLLLLSNHSADKHGSFGYTNCSCNDSLAFKGFIYVYFKKHHTLVLNTHLESAGDGTERLAQIEEIKQFIARFTISLNQEIESMKDTARYNKKLKVICCGDWNVDMTNYDKICKDNGNKTKLYQSESYADLPEMFGSTYKKTNGCNPTCNDEQWGCLDHIFANFEFVSFEEEIHGKEAKLSDHLLIKNEFTFSHSKLNTI